MNKCDCKCINVPCRGVCHGTAALACSAANSERDTVRVPPVVNGLWAYGLMGLMGVMQGVPMGGRGGGNDVLWLTARPDRELPS